MNMSQELGLKLPLGEAASFEKMKFYGETLQRFVQEQEENLPDVLDNSRHDAIVDYLLLLANSYNEQLRLFRQAEKQRQKGILVAVIKVANGYSY